MESRKPVTPPRVPAEIRNVLRHLEKWRSNRKHRTPIPELLWRSAAELAHQHGVARVSRLLRLDYYTLKERLDALCREKRGRVETKPSFVELPSFAAGSVLECIVELEDQLGARMRIHVKGGSAPDLAALSRAFWSLEG